MRFSHSLLLASVAILTLPSCSSAKGPGEIGSKNDIVVRNFGDAPPPPSEEMLMQEPATPPEMMAARTLQGDIPEIDDSEARMLAAQHESEVAAQAPHADAVQAQMQAEQEAQLAQERLLMQQEQLAAQAQMQATSEEQQIPRAPEPTQMQRQAEMAQQQVVQQGGMEAVPPPTVNDVRSLSEQATQGMTMQDNAQAAADSTRAGVVGYAGVSPDVDAGLDVRPQVAPPMGAETAQVMAAPAVQASTEFQAQPVEQAAQHALQNPPTPYGEQLANPDVQAQLHHQQQAVSTPPAAAPATAYATRTSRVPSAEDLAAGGMRVVITEQGTPTIGQQLVPPPSAPVAAPAPAPVAPAPAPTPAAAVSLGDPAMISRAQAALSEKGFYTGPADGQISTQFLNALSRYQSANFLTPGMLNHETAQHLGLIQ